MGDSQWLAVKRRSRCRENPVWFENNCLKLLSLSLYRLIRVCVLFCRYFCFCVASPTGKKCPPQTQDHIISYLSSLFYVSRLLPKQWSFFLFKIISLQVALINSDQIKLISHLNNPTCCSYIIDCGTSFPSEVVFSARDASQQALF